MRALPDGFPKFRWLALIGGALSLLIVLGLMKDFRSDERGHALAYWSAKLEQRLGIPETRTAWLQPHAVEDWSVAEVLAHPVVESQGRHVRMVLVPALPLASLAALTVIYLVPRQIYRMGALRIEDRLKTLELDLNRLQRQAEAIDRRHDASFSRLKGQVCDAAQDVRAIHQHVEAASAYLKQMEEARKTSLPRKSRRRAKRKSDLAEDRGI